MNRILHLIAIFAILCAGVQVNAQCEPDPGCVDTGIPGEFCPKFLTDAIVNKDYNAVITIIPPGTVTANSTTYEINYIIVDSVGNMPEGLSYTTTTDKFYADSAYCILVSGIPEEEGVYPLSITVTPYVFFSGGTIPGPTVTNDTSVAITVLAPSGIDPSQAHEFKLLPNVPNPFFETTRLGFYTPFDDKIELRVYNILGELIHQETEGFSPGEHYFNYDGHTLQPGTYIYRVINHEEFFTGKFIKVRM